MTSLQALKKSETSQAELTKLKEELAAKNRFSLQAFGFGHDSVTLRSSFALPCDVFFEFIAVPCVFAMFGFYSSG